MSNRSLTAAGLATLAAIPGAYYLRHQFLRTRGRAQYDKRSSRLGPRILHRPDGSTELRNPIVRTGADPLITPLDDGSGEYLYVYSDHDRIVGKIGPNIYDWDQREPAWTWTDPAQTNRLVDYWAPEVHRVRGQWVCYFAANHGEALARGKHRTYGLTAIDNDPRQGFALDGKLPLEPDVFAIDATPLELDDKLYLIWSGTANARSLNQRLYITAMDAPLLPTGPRTLIAKPGYDWELRGRRGGLWPSINEGPQVIKHNGQVFVLYSASGSWSDHYCLGLLELTGDDPLDANAWTKYPAPVFESAGDVLAPGHASTVRYRDQDFLIYHTAKHTHAGWDREVHLKPFGWTRAGLPDFGAPPPREQLVWTDPPRT